MTADDKSWERRLNISTGAADYEHEDANHSRYEPTSYAVLERLASGGYIGRDSVVVDYGCGKGRVDFYLHHAVGCRTIGVEYDAAMYAAAMENLRRYTTRRSGRPEFVCANAENYAVGDADCFYFFNPFSVKILRSVLGRIYASYYDHPRPMRLFFYYALDDYIGCLMDEDMLRFEAEIDCRDLFPSANPLERILIYAID